MKQSVVLIIPGLGNNVSRLQLATRHWRKYDVLPMVFFCDWAYGDFQTKLKELLSIIDNVPRDCYQISVLGTSAGASAALNLFAERKAKIHRMINVCGRLRTGPTTGFRSFAAKTKSSQAFAQSIKLAEKNEKLLAKSDRQKILTLRPKYGDELVPSETVIVEGATNLTLPTIEHVLSITLALTLFSQPIIKFIKE